MEIFDQIIVGKGLIGSAAAKYISTYKKNVAIIGPDEPLDLNNSIVYSSHFDQARIQRIIGADSIWTLLNLQSARIYNSLEKESGISFHSKPGCLYVNPHGMDTYLTLAAKQASQFGLTYTSFQNGKDIVKAFPDFYFPETSRGLYETSPSGFINPMLLIKAQLKVFEKNNGRVINDIATKITAEENCIRIDTNQGDIYKTKKVLLAPGAFINFFNLIKNKLAVSLKSETTLLANVSKEEALRLSHLPSLLYEIDIPEYQNIYLIQPVLYPDGKYYIKMGCNLPGDLYFSNLEDIQTWFRTGASDAHVQTLKDALKKIIPGLNAKQFFTKRCIVSFTRHRKPYIGKIDERLYVACGGNGYSAMCSDALGKIASHVLINDIFPEEYSPDSFQPVFEN